MNDQFDYDVLIIGSGFGGSVSALRLAEKGYKVAICEQLETPAQAKGLVKRDIVRVITPGTVMESSMLDEAKNNFICNLSKLLMQTS